MWQKLRVNLHGPEGVRVRWREDEYTCSVWISGSEHPSHWWHHFLPGAARREIKCAGELANILLGLVRNKHLIIGGHSLGGCLAEITATLLSDAEFAVSVFTFGSKRPPWRYRFYQPNAYRHRGDIIPLLPFWRPKRKAKKFGKWEPVWKSHLPHKYYRIAQEEGLR